MTPERIFLEIDKMGLLCEKQKLIDNSDYFRAMLDGNFVEGRKKVIVLEGIDYKAMEIIVKLLSNELHPIDDEDVLVVLQTACVLRFEKIREKCIEQITGILCPINCLKIWYVTEKLQIKPLFLHAKAMALEEFLIAKDTSYILEFTLEDICNYLGHIYLKTDTEFSVFHTAMDWWIRNNPGQYWEDNLGVLLKLLSCIHWPSVSDDNFKQMMTYPYIACDLRIVYILCCILLIKDGRFVENFSVECRQKAWSLFRAEKRRSSPTAPCILANFVQSKDKTINVPKEEKLKVIYYDKFKRKRFYQILDNNKNDNLATIFYDLKLRKFKTYFHFDGNKCTGLEGFGLKGDKGFVYLYGGEYLIGRGNWNYNLWMYDVMRATWHRKSLVPCKRRHFQTCMAGNNLYIIGGTGAFRVIEDDMYFYNFIEDRWSERIQLPFSGRQLKCCNFLNQLLIVNLRNKCGFLFNGYTNIWLRVDILVDDIVVNTMSDYSIFAYNNFLYVKGNHLIMFDFVDLQIRCVSYTCGISVYCDKLEIVLCDNIVYTLYKQRYEDNDLYTLETFNLDNGHLDHIFKDIPSDAVIDINGDLYTISPSLKMSALPHHCLVEDNRLINDAFV